MTTVPDPATRPRSAFASTTIIVIASIVLLFMLAFIAGMIAAGMEQEGPHSAYYYVILGIAALMVLGTVWTIWRNLRSFSLPTSPRMRKTRILLYACIAVGVVAGAGVVIVDGPDASGLDTLFSATAPISAPAAIALVLTMLVATALSARWHMLLDEHERASYDFGAVIALYAYFIVSICWWLLARGGLAPAPDGYLIFWLVTILWVIGWAIRRYR
jgi:hypothetical protein